MTDKKEEGTTVPNPAINNVLIGIDGIPIYEGHDSIEEFICILEETAILANWTEQQKLSVARLKLRGKAKLILDAEPTLKSTTKWKDLKDALYNQFTKQLVTGTAIKQFIECKQRVGESCRQFLTRLKVLGNKTIKVKGEPFYDQAISTKLEQDITSQFMMGLSMPIKQRVLSGNPSSLDQALELAEREETIENFLHPSTSRECRVVNNNKNQERDKQLTCFTCKKVGHTSQFCSQRKGFNGNCFQCGKAGHWRNECRQKQNTQTWNRRSRCYQCQQEGHIARFCPNEQRRVRGNTLNSNTAALQPRSMAVEEARWE